jgi:AraC-like DNA-binding protein
MARKEIGVNYLKSGKIQVKQIGYFLGYNETTSFNRTFKRWTDFSPRNYQTAIIGG